MHIGIKPGASYNVERDTYHYGSKYHEQQRLLAVERITIDTVYDGKCAAVHLILLRIQELRQINEAESRSTHNGKSSKQSKVLQQFRPDEDKPHKRTDSGKASQADRLDLVAQHLFRIADIFIVRHDVQHITECHPQHNRPDTKCQQRELPLNKIHGGKPEKRAEHYRQQQQRYSVVIAEADEDKEQNQYQRTGNSPFQIGLYPR